MSYHNHKKQFSDSYFNSGVLIIHLKGLKKAVVRKKFDSLMDYYTWLIKRSYPSSLTKTVLNSSGV